MKHFLLVGFFLIWGCKSSSNPSPAAFTQVEFADTTYDFGKIKEGETVIHFFPFKNTGESDFLIRKVETGCGCTSVDYPQKPVKPGTSGKITIEFNSSGRYGKQYKEIRIFANLPKGVQNIGFTADVR